MTESQDPFVTTRWTLVIRAKGESDEARTALSDLCECYYAPVHRFIRSKAHDREAARDLTQEFFARVLRGGTLPNANPEHGKFRCYLLGAVKHFLSDMNERNSAAKRGGGQIHESIDISSDTRPAIDLPAPSCHSPDRDFDRNWAITMLDSALNKLAAEMRSAGKERQFDTLKPWLTDNVVGTTQADAARSLGITEGAVKVAVHRLRRKFRQFVELEITQTLASPGDLESELGHLLESVSR